MIERQNKQLLLKPGEPLRGFQGTTPEGETRQLDSSNINGSTLILVFSVSCGICGENSLHRKKLLVDLAGSSVRVVGVTPDPANHIRGFLNANDLCLETLSVAGDSAVTKSNRWTVFPQTIVLDPDGRVVRIWAGLLDESRRIRVKNASLGKPDVEEDL